MEFTFKYEEFPVISPNNKLVVSVTVDITQTDAVLGDVTTHLQS